MMGSPQLHSLMCDRHRAKRLAFSPSLLFEDLPQDVLHRILVKHTGSEDKVALRETCRLFRDQLDTALKSIATAQPLGSACQWKRLQLLPHLQSLQVSMYAEECLHWLPWQLKSLHLQRLTLGNQVDLRSLTNLPWLTCLSLWAIDPRDAWHGLTSLTGLTQLRVKGRAGSIQHLSATLQHLEMYDFDNAQGLWCLTRLQTLVCHNNVPATFFQTHNLLPLKHIATAFSVSVGQHAALLQLDNPVSWLTAPTTLTSIGILNSDFIRFTRETIPPSVTNLQYLNGYRSWEEAAELMVDALCAAPHLKCLNIGLWYQYRPYQRFDPGLFLAFSRLKSVHLRLSCLPEQTVEASDQLHDVSQVIMTVTNHGIEVTKVTEMRQHGDDPGSWFQHGSKITQWCTFTEPSDPDDMPSWTPACVYLYC